MTVEFKFNVEWHDKLTNDVEKNIGAIAEEIAKKARGYAPRSNRRNDVPVTLRWATGPRDEFGRGRLLTDAEMSKLRLQGGEFTGDFEKIEAWIPGKTKSRRDVLYPISEVRWTEPKGRGRKKTKDVIEEQLGDSKRAKGVPVTGRHLQDSIKVIRDDSADSGEVRYDILADRPYAKFVEFGWHHKKDSGHYEGAQGGQGFLRKALLESEELLTSENILKRTDE